jgi:hypothetical protein
LEEVQAAVEGLVGQYKDEGDEPVFFCNIQLDQLKQAEQVKNPLFTEFHRRII